MELKIYSNDGKVKLTVEPRESSTQTEEIQTGDVLTVSFTLPRRVSLEVNDYTDFMGRRYWLTERYRPVQKSTVEWEYSMKLYGLENMISRFLVLNTTDGGNEAVFTLTAPPREHVGLIVKSINAGFGANDWKTGSVEGGDNIVVDYHGKYCDEGLKALAEATGTEYWIEGTTVNLCRCEHGERVALGYRNGLTKIQPDMADNVKVYTRLFPVGSSKNIDPAKYGHSRLQLPDGVQYVDVNTDKYGIIHHYEEKAFEGIFPRYTGTVSSVRSEELTGEDGNKFTVYYFKDDNLPFDPNQYEIGGLVKRVSFQEGSELAGLGNEDDGTYYFEVNFDSETREFELITIWPYDDETQLPGGTLAPKAGDRYIPWNIRMPDEYYALAEAEFLEAAHEYNRRHSVDISCFKVSTDYTEIERRKLDLHVGQRVRLESDDYFQETGYKDSRITKITRKINRPSQMDLEISDALSTGALDRIQGNIDEVKTNLQLVRGNLPDIIRTGDCTPFTDNNLLSASRTRHDFLSKLKDDRAKGKIASDMGFEIGNYLAGVSGGMFGIDKTDGQSFADVFRLYVHGKAYFETLTIIEANTLAGKHYITPGGAIKCSKVEEVKNETGAVTAYRCYFLSEQDGEKTETKIVAGDQAISEMFNAKTGTTNKVSNHRYWRLVTAVNNDAYTDESGNHYGYVELSATDCEAGSDIPQEGDVIDQLGNRTDKTRQAAMIFSTVDPDAPSIKLLTGIDHYTLTSKDIISQGYDPVKGHAFFNCYGDLFIGDKDGSTYIKYDQDTKSLLAKLKLTIDSTIDGKTLNDYFSSLIPELTQEDIEDFVNNIISPKLDGIQNQIDGVIETWFSNGVPTLNNYPASSWITGDDKEKHLGDLYFDNDSGLAYRFSKNTDGSYYWNDKVDSATAKALAAAAKAQDTADGKRRVFTSQPVPPYDKGDLWVNATYPAGTTALTRDPSTGKYYLDILRCGSAKAAGGSFAIGDWGLASNYTDDTLAQAAKKAADAAQKAADDAQADADEAKDRLDGWAADSVISPTEKQAIKDEIARIDGDKAHIEAEYARYSLGAPTVYTAAYTAYRAQLVALSASTPENIAIPADFALNQTAYYTQRTGALTAIAAAAKKYAEDVAKNEANKAIAGLEYLKEAMVNGASQAIGGLFLSSHIRLGQWDKSDPTNPVLSKTYAGLNGLIPDSLTYKGSAIAAWYGGEMEDLFSYNAITGKYDLLTTLSPTKRYAASLFRMDGSMYLAKGNMFVQPDGFTQWGKGSSAVTISPEGVVSLGNGIKINIGGDVQGLADALSSLLTIVNGLNNVLYPIDVAGNRLNWSAPVESIHAIKAVKGFFSTEFISALGLVTGNLGGGSGTGGSLFGLMRSWPSVDPGPSTQEALGANLGWELRNRISALETAGFATQNWVLNKNYLTAHQDISHLLSKTEAASLYQPKGNYLTSHQSLSHLLRIDGSNGTAAGVSTLIGKLSDATADVLDSTKFVTSDNAGDATSKLYYRRPATALWNYIKGKADAVYQPKGNYALASALGNYYTKTEVNTKLTNGSVTKIGTATVGASNWPIYLNNGVPYACAWKFGNYNGAAAVNNGTLNENLNADMLDGHHKTDFNAVARFGTTATPTSGYYKVKIKSTAAWMLGFKILAYQNYCFDEINISGYNYGNSHWHLPSATLVNSQGNNKKSSIAVTFGYDSAWNLWVAIPAAYYAGISVTDVVNGYNQVADPHSLFEIVYEDTLTGTVQGTHTATCHALLTDNVASASRLQTTATYTAWGQTYFANGVPQNVSGNMTGVGIIKFSAGNEIAFANSRFCFGATNQTAAQGVNVGSLLVSNAWADYTKVPVNGIYIKGALRIGDITIEEDKANGGLKISGGVYATQYVSALGLATGNLSGGSSGGGTAYDRLDAWADYTTDKAGYVLSAGLGADLNSRVGANATSINSILSRLNSLEGGGTTSVTVTGSGNAITDISKGGTAIIATKGATFLTQHQSLDYIKVKDIRNTTPKPNDYVSNRVTAWFNNYTKPVAGLSDWYSGINVTGWSSSNYAEWELVAACDNKIQDKNLYFRVGLGETWEAWQKILTSANYASVLGSVYQAKGDYVTVAGTQTITGAKTFVGGLLMPYSAGTWISMAKRANQILGSVPNAGSSAHSLFTLLNSTGAAISYGGLGVNIGFYGFYKSRMDSGANSYDWATTWNLNTGRLTHSGDLVAHSFIKNGGTSSQFLKADGSVDSNSYALASALNNYYTKTDADSRYVRSSNTREMLWEWGGTTPTHVWGAKGGDSTKAYVFTGDNIRAFANAVNKAGDTMTGALNFGNANCKVYNSDNKLVFGAGDGIDKLVIEKNVVRRSSQTPTVDLGSSGLRWSNVYATTINVTSTGLVSNLNADMLDGKHYSQMASGGHAQYAPAGPAAGRWIRIARSNTINNGTIYNAYAIISLSNTYYNNHTEGVTFAVYLGYRNWARCTITQLGGYGGSLWPKVRIVYPTAANTAYYIEVFYNTTSILNEIGVEMTGSFNMELYGTYTAGEIPTGYAAKEQPLTVGMSAERFTSSVPTGTAPLTVASTTLVSNLNADMLDGLHSTSFGRAFGNSAIDANDYNSLNGLWGGKLYNATNVPYNYYAFLHFGWGQYYGQFNAYNNQLQFRAGSESNGGPAWKTVAFTDSNVASATKLQTARTIYGVNFDGTANVNGAFYWRGTDATLRIYEGVDPTAPSSYGYETLCLQSCFDAQDPLTSGYVTTYAPRCILALQPRGGRVAIGSLSAAYTLDVTGTGRFTGELTALAAYTSNWFRSTGNSGWYSQTYGGGIYMTDANWVRVYNNKAFRVQEGVAIGAMGFNVGLKLHGALYEALEVSAGNYSMGLGCHSNGSWYWWRGTANPEGSGNKSYVMLYDGDTWNFTGKIFATAGVWSDGFVSALGRNDGSDARLKTITGDAELPIETILNAPAKRFVWNALTGETMAGRKAVGTLAQYWAKHLPETVNMMRNGYLGLDYAALDWVAIHSTAQYAHRGLTDHEERIRNLESENKKLRAELNGLRSRLRA